MVDSQKSLELHYSEHENHPDPAFPMIRDRGILTDNLQSFPLKVFATAENHGSTGVDESCTVCWRSRMHATCVAVWLYPQDCGSLRRTGLKHKFRFSVPSIRSSLKGEKASSKILSPSLVCRVGPRATSNGANNVCMILLMKCKTNLTCVKLFQSANIQT